MNKHEIRALRREVERSGPARRGRKFPVGLRDRVIAAVRALHTEGTEWRDIGEQLGINWQTAQRYCEQDPDPLPEEGEVVSSGNGKAPLSLATSQSAGRATDERPGSGQSQGHIAARSVDARAAELVMAGSDSRSAATVQTEAQVSPLLEQTRRSNGGGDAAASCSGDLSVDPIRTPEPERLEASAAVLIPTPSPDFAPSRAVESSAQANEAPGTVQSGGASQADELLALARDNAELFVDDNGEPLAAVEVKSRREIVGIRSRHFRTWLHHLYYEKYKTMPKAAAIKSALAVVEGTACFGSVTQSVHVRVAKLDDSIYLDLANDEGEVVRISRGGWEIIRSREIKFRHSKGMAPLPRPVRGGSVNELRPFVNVASDDAFHLLVAWQVCALRPEGPYPLVVFQGEHGSTKTTATRVTRTTVDASKIPVRSMPRSERDLAVAVSSAWVLALDNQSGFSSEMSDALCRVSTGGGFGGRQLYTDGDEFVMAFMRPVVVNGIDDLATRPDLAERALVFHLPPMPPDRRIDEATLMARFSQAHPRILGALLDGVASAIKNVDSVRLDGAPRMADFARWATAAEHGLGWRQGTFLEAYLRHRSEVDQETLDRDVLGSMIPRLPTLVAHSSWSGTATHLLRELNALVDDSGRTDPAWPRRANALTARLRRITPLLRAAGYVVTFRRENVERAVSITRAISSPSSPSSPGLSPADTE